MKFTEEQYQKIVIAWYFEDTYAEATQAVIDVISVFVTEDLQDEALAIANPLTREWAHEQFVEKEKKYVWTSKKMSSDGTRLRLQNTGTNGVVRAYGKFKDRKADWTEHLTESEIKAWGYNPEMFNKEEVE